MNQEQILLKLPLVEYKNSIIHGTGVYAKEDISKYYTSPMKLFEYMAVGRPIVASHIPSIAEILNEENSVLVKPDDPEALARGIRFVLENNEFAEKISSQAYIDVQKYTWEARAKLISDFIIRSIRILNN